MCSVGAGRFNSDVEVVGLGVGLALDRRNEVDLVLIRPGFFLIVAFTVNAGSDSERYRWPPVLPPTSRSPRPPRGTAAPSIGV